MCRAVNRSPDKRRNNKCAHHVVVDAQDCGAAEEGELVTQIAAGDIEAPMTELLPHAEQCLYCLGTSYPETPGALRAPYV